MRILLLSSNTGEGHNSTAKAIMEVLEARGVVCVLRDVLACLSPRFSKFVCGWHTRIYKYGPRLFDVGYRAFEHTGSEPEETTPVYDLLALGARKLWELVMEGNYDAVICTHVFSGMMMTELRRVWGVRIPCFFVATDYTCSPTVEQCEMDGYFIPSAELAEEFAAAGLPREKLIPSGIPVRQEFYRPGDRERVRQVLNLPRDSFTVVLMCGSMGCGPIRKIARELCTRLEGNAQVVAICGRNEKLFDSLSELTGPRLRVLGFTTDIPDYMDAADLIVTKPGGLSSTEAANKHLPMVFINSVGGCEGRNFDFFLNRGYAVGSDDPDEVLDQVVALAADPTRREAASARLREDFHANSAQVIADRVAEAAQTYAETRAAGISRLLSGYPSSEEGGIAMEQQQTVTIGNLARSFAGESQARTRYDIYAQVARQEGHEWIARIFEETAANEAVHAERFLEMIRSLGGCADNIEIAAGYPYQLGDTLQNLSFAAAGELHEHDEAYPAFAEAARREGCDDAARLWMQIARIEGVHHNTFKELYDQLCGGTLTEKKKPILWKCARCGYTYESTRACDPCPVCGKAAGWQEGDLDQKKMIRKKS